MAETFADPKGLFVIDDTSFPKQGRHFVGVQRQYCGVLGKWANCQVAPSVHYVSPKGHCPLAMRLYLPESWLDDPKRLNQVGVLEACRQPRSKGQIALELLDQVRVEGWPGQVVVADAGYGVAQDVRDGLHQRGLHYLVGVTEEMVVFTVDDSSTIGRLSPWPLRRCRKNSLMPSPIISRRNNPSAPRGVIIDSVTVRAFGGGEATGPSPVDRRKSGTKHTLMVDPSGVPLAIRTAGANASDHTQIIPLVLDFPKVGGKPGRPNERPDDLYADRGYDSDSTRALLRWLGVEPHIAKRRTPHGSGLGQVRWVVELTISWLKGLRRLRVRYDQLGVIIDARTTLAANVICFRMLHRDVI